MGLIFRFKSNDEEHEFWTILYCGDKICEGYKIGILHRETIDNIFMDMNYRETIDNITTLDGPGSDDFYLDLKNGTFTFS
jgi:hypothetical protein